MVKRTRDTDTPNEEQKKKKKSKRPSKGELRKLSNEALAMLIHTDPTWRSLRIDAARERMLEEDLIATYVRRLRSPPTSFHKWSEDVRRRHPVVDAGIPFNSLHSDRVETVRGLRTRWKQLYRADKEIGFHEWENDEGDITDELERYLDNWGLMTEGWKTKMDLKEVRRWLMGMVNS